jgi:tripartite-type tricarboxylate transporter receptor subunit TctC
MTKIDRRQVLKGSSTLLASLPASAVDAQGSYPERPIRVIVPFAAGGVGDMIVRLLAPKLEEKLGQKLVIESKPGAGGHIGTQEVARARPDGYTMLVGATGNFVINQFLMKTSVDPLTALIPVAKLADIPIVFFSNSSVPARGFAEFVAYARANPGKLNYGSQGIGLVNHLLIERLQWVAGIEMAHVPFSGSPTAMVALLSNQIQLFSAAWAVGAGHPKDGKLTVLAVTAAERLPALPDVPTVTEAGFPSLAILNWWAMAAPKGTPEPVIRLLDQAVVEALRDPVVNERFAALGMIVPAQTREQFSNSLKSEAAFWSEIIRGGNIVVEK